MSESGATRVAFFVPKTAQFVCFTDTPFARPGYPGFDIDKGGEPGFRLFIGDGTTMNEVEIGYVETYGNDAGPFSIDGENGESVVIYAPEVPERHPGLHGRLNRARMTRLDPDEYTWAETDGKVTITRT